MAEPLSAHIMRLIPQARHMYHRLVLVVAPLGAGKTAALREVAQQTGYNYINVNLELSRCMLELTQRQRQLQASRLLRDIIRTAHEQAVLLDNLEMLFDVSLKLDPLRCLQDVARERTVVAAWNGAVTAGHLTYATSDHPEYRRYALEALVIVCPEVDS
jgi:ATPase family protein associated with various cellular activities (AAA)